jgi:alkylated DNA repair dioxygenase AlkB
VSSPTPALAIDRGATVERVPLGEGASWVDVCPGFVHEPEALLAEVLDRTPWQQGEVWRFDRYVEEHRLGAWLREDELPAAVRQTGLHLESRYRVPFQGVTAIHYRDGEDFQGLHSDREMRWLDDTLIAILVLGEARPFVLRPRRDVNDPAQRADASEDVVLRPGHGTLVVMGGRCQRDWLHGIPADPTSRPRVSLTWRWTSRRGRPDTAPGYFDGRSYSDRPAPRGHRMRPL